MNRFLEGKRIYLRSVKKMDISTWYKWFNDSWVTEFMNKGFYPNTKAEQEKYFNHLLNSKTDLQLAIVLKKNNTLIGMIGVHKIQWVHRRGDVSIVIGNTTQWGKGIAKEAIELIIKHAFTKMNLRRLAAGVWAPNPASEKCFKKCGFKFEGTKRKNFFYKGDYVDEHIFGLLKEEWEKIYAGSNFGGR